MISLAALILVTISRSTPLVFASLGGVVSERSGVVNIGIEGMILFGAFSAMATSYYTGNPWLALLIAGVAGGLLALIHAFISITLGGSQAVSSTGIVLFAGGITSFGVRMITGRAGNSDPVNSLPNSPLLANVPWIGDYLSRLSPIVYLALLTTVFVIYFMNYTALGMRIHSVGENPKVAETLGLNVWKIRYFSVIFSGVLAGFGGAYLSIGQMNMFQENMSAGRGYLALAAVILGRWRPLGVVIASLFFGFFEVLQVQLQTLPNQFIPTSLLSAVPYFVALFVLAFSFGKSKVPSAIGQPYLKRID